MLKNKIKKILIIAGVILGLGFIFSYKPKPIQQIPNTTIEYKDTKVNLYDSIKEDLNKVGRIEVLRVQTGKKVDISNDINWSWLKNTLTIDYKVQSHFYIEITDNNNISINGNTLTIYCNKPIIESNIDYDLTKYTKDKGLLVIGDIKLTPGEVEDIENKVCDEVTKEVESEFETARINAEKIIEKLLLKSNNQIRNVKINYI